ncbi:MAG: signal peptidase II, partial [Variibacter sp.]|nr:signal peptidase II [Variibacter sp.]
MSDAPLHPDPAGPLPAGRWLWGRLSGLGLAVTAVICGLDQASKLWLLHIFDLGSRGPVPLAPWLDLVLTWNRGISYGLLQQNTALGRILLLAFTAGACAVLWVWLARTSSRLGAVALGLILGGAVGNAIDRAAYGAVADFVFFHLDFGSWQFRWYVFNLA